MEAMGQFTAASGAATNSNSSVGRLCQQWLHGLLLARAFLSAGCGGRDCQTAKVYNGRAPFPSGFRNFRAADIGMVSYADERGHGDQLPLFRRNRGRCLAAV